MSVEQLSALRWWFLRLAGVAGYGVLLWLTYLGHKLEWYVWVPPIALIHPRVLEILGQFRPQGK